MFRKFAFALALTLLPAAAMAQEHQHHAPAAKKHEHKAEHKMFPQQLIEMRTELKLTDEQVTKLKALSVKMEEHHKTMGKPEHADDEGKLHVELLKIFNEEQRKKVVPLMRAHMDEMKAPSKE